jgi:mannose/fructose/sorbose-specific phosphotransferase system IIA component
VVLFDHLLKKNKKEIIVYKGDLVVGIMIISHGEFASGLLDAVRMITGGQKQIRAIAFNESQSPDDLKKNVEDTLQLMDEGEGVLLFADLFGATPFNVAMRVYMESDRKMEVIAGANLPIVLEAVLCRDQKDLRSIYQSVLEVGADSIKTIPEGIRKS